MKFCQWNHYAFPGWHVQVGQAGKKSQTWSPAFQGIRFQLAHSFLMCFFLLVGAKVEHWECQKVAGDIFSAVEHKITKMLACPPPSLISSPLVPLYQGHILYLSPLVAFSGLGSEDSLDPSFLAASSFSSACGLLGRKCDISDAFSFCCFAS